MSTPAPGQEQLHAALRAVACPRCEAPAGESCVYTYGPTELLGQPWDGTHIGRVVALRDAREECDYCGELTPGVPVRDPEAVRYLGAAALAYCTPEHRDAHNEDRAAWEGRDA